MSGAGATRLVGSPVAERLTIPGFVNAHSHAFQRALRGRAGGGDFWAWRDAMLARGRRADAGARPRRLRARLPRDARAPATPRSASSTTSASTEALAAAEAAEAAGIGFVLLYAAYARGGLERFRQPSVAAYLERRRAAPRPGHARRPRPPLRPRVPARLAARRSAGTPRPRACRSTSTPTSSRARSRNASPSTASARSSCSRGRAVSARARPSSTRRTPTTRELDLLAESGTRICACPTTEANLGDGFLPVERVLERGIGVCIGSDSNVRIDPLEELRELEGIARRARLRRDVIGVDDLALVRLGRGRGSARARRLGRCRDRSRASARWPASTEADVLGALVFGCSADVLV